MNSLYDITRKEVDPLADTLKAVVELNYHIERAWQAGWDVTLSISQDSAKVDVRVERNANWPTPHDEPQP